MKQQQQRNKSKANVEQIWENDWIREARTNNFCKRNFGSLYDFVSVFYGF